MFEHSVKVPRSYKLAAKIVQQVKEEGKALKSLLYQIKNQHFPIQRIHALVAETLKHGSQLNELLKKTGLLINEPRFDPWLARIFITELLWGKKTLNGDCKPIQTIYQYHDEFLSLLGSLENEIEKELYKPRYIRINTLRLTAADAVRYFQDEGWNLVRCTAGSYDDYLQQVKNLGPYDFIPDYHVKVVFVFAPDTAFYDCELYQNNDIFLQDKATTLAGFLLAPTPGSTVLDMCAAPGMKTTHLAALIKNEGTIYAVEQDLERYNVLSEFVEKSGSTCVKPLNRDVAAVTKTDCPNVDYVLLDPSCSGSGIRRIQSNDAISDLESGRVKSLSNFQAKLLRHALNEFSDAKRIVYSTCSLYPEENEQVIEDVITNHKGNYRLVSAKDKLNGWNNIGDLKYVNIGEKCVYARPESDYTCGFFIAVFEKISDEEVLKEKQSIQNSNKVKRSKHKNIKRPTDEEEVGITDTEDCIGNKKSKKKTLKIQHDSEDIADEEASNVNTDLYYTSQTLDIECDKSEVKKSKKKKKNSVDEIDDVNRKSKKKSKSEKCLPEDESTPAIEVVKKSKKMSSFETSEIINLDPESDVINKKSKKKNKSAKSLPEDDNTPINGIILKSKKKNKSGKSLPEDESAPENAVIKKPKKISNSEDKNIVQCLDGVNYSEILESDIKKASKSGKKKKLQSQDSTSNEIQVDITESYVDDINHSNVSRLEVKKSKKRKSECHPQLVTEENLLSETISIEDDGYPTKKKKAKKNK